MGYIMNRNDENNDRIVSFLCDTKGNIIDANKAFQQVFDIDLNKQTKICDLFIDDCTEELAQYHHIVINTQKPSYVRHEVTIGTKRDHFLFKRFLKTDKNKVMGVMTRIFLDERDFTQEDLENDAYKDEIKDLGEGFDFMVVTDRNGYFQYISPGTSKLLGYSLSEMIGHKRVAFMNEENAKSMMERFLLFYNNRTKFFGLQNVVRTKDGKSYTFISNGVPLFTQNGEFMGYRVTNHNLTPMMVAGMGFAADPNSVEHIIKSVKGTFHQLSSAVTQMTRIQNVVSSIARSFLRAKIDNLSDKINESLALIGQTTQVDRSYIFIFNEDRTLLSNIYEWCNEDIEPAIDMLQNLDSSVFEWSIDLMRKDQIINIFDVNAMTEEQKAERDILQMQGILSLLIVPLIYEGELIGFLGFDSVNSHKRWKDEIDMISVLAEVYSAALVRMKNEKLLMETLDRNELILNQTIEAFASIVEISDPYTSGHQDRTARLSIAIAKKLGLSGDIEKSLRYASLLHDLGKFYIPSQILNKPGKLSEIEFSLIKTHPNLGYQVLKKIDFPWPIADIVIQHHERIDGSGYPYELIGNEILMEARILAVADVVESMSSHRPYRAALGLNAALYEIRRNKGVLFDSRVVQACLDLFEKDGFVLDSLNILT